MAWPGVTVNQLNQLAGETKEIERHLLFIGTGKTNTGKLQAVSSQSDLDALLGDTDSVLKSNVEAARLNAGQNFYAHVWVLSDSEDWADAVRSAQVVSSFEGVVLCMDIKSKDEIEKAIALRQELISAFGRWTWFVIAVRGIQLPAPDAEPPVVGEDWSAYTTVLAELQKGVAEKSVQLVPRNWGNEPGVLAGRLCSRAVTVADSPARVKTGPVVMLGKTDIPTDKDGNQLSLATLRSWEENRYSVPMWYPDYDGIYWSDGRTLDVEGGDYQSIQSLRVVDKVARRIRLQGIARIADRSLNSTPASVAENQMFFAKTLRDMSKASQINGVTFPGECLPPKDGDVTIQWESKTKVRIFVVVRTYECPLGIEINLMLDSALNGGNG
ncbi:MAG: DUF2586 domain-containing protein [Plesiomonas sp.]|uniref:DUF2586 family protein n=1 Tax=Plesiomonas shigelloides TaxID=703 RepID=A0A8I1W675_PLESH|nr:DUF2586 domain-containing protein [Plesiomonas shigelloides]MBO1107896.1 DUF2586 family protein [Plesiomonas shigelloides]